MDIIKLSFEEELILLGNWLLEKNREDLFFLEDNTFINKKLFKGIKEGYTYTQLKDKDLLGDISYTALLNYGTEPGAYETARANALKTQKSIYANRIATGEGNTEELTKKINELQAQIDHKEYKPLSNDFTEDFLEDLKEKQEEKQAQYGKGFKYLDKYTNGIHRGQLIVIGARPRVGKSAMALQVAGNVVEQGYKTLFLPLEMTKNETIERLLLQQQIVTREELNDPTEKNIEDIKTYLNNLTEQGLFYIGEGVNHIQDIEKKIKAQKPYLVVIDQLTQVRPLGKSKDNREKYIEITRELKRIAMDNKVAIILLSQLNRASAEMKHPGIEALHESDSTGQDADVVITLAIDNEEDNIHETERETTLYLAKQRNGLSGKSIPLMYRGERFTFAPIEQQRINRV